MPERPPCGIYQVEALVRYAGATTPQVYRVGAVSGEDALRAAKAVAKARGLAWVGLTGLTFLQPADRV